jgi:hypothetical protein
MTETQTTPATPTDASANGQAVQPKTTAPKRTASRATRAAAKAQPARTAPKQAANGKAQPAAKAQPKQAAKQQPKAEPKTDSRAGKRELATRVVLAIADMVKGLSAADLKALGMTRDEAAACASTWVHHIPADREQWVKVLPKPDRSDWR